VDGEQGGRGRERGAEQDRAAVARPDAGEREADGDRGGGAGGDDHGEEVGLRAEVDRRVADQHDGEQRHRCGRRGEEVAKTEAVVPSVAHPTRYRRARPAI
jgi:hypothetical protein